MRRKPLEAGRDHLRADGVRWDRRDRAESRMSVSSNKKERVGDDARPPHPLRYSAQRASNAHTSGKPISSLNARKSCNGTGRSSVVCRSAKAA